jgi:hypothetical protein
MNPPMLVTPSLTPLLAMLALLLFMAPDSSRGSQQQPPLQRGPTVVELFTSQGCSSCPPADALLGELASRPDILALGFHVDFWDNLGWRDRYSMHEATQRQYAYVETLRLSSAFTPQVVIGGRASFVGSDRGRIGEAVSQPTAGPSVQPDVGVADGELVISLPASGDSRRCDVDLVAYVSRSATPISRGENSGRTLIEFNVVRQLLRLGEWEGKGATFRIRRNALPDDADRVAVLVQESHQGPVVGAVSARLR